MYITDFFVDCQIFCLEGEIGKVCWISELHMKCLLLFCHYFPVPVNSVISYSDVSEKDLQNIENTMIEYHSKVHQTLSDTTHSEILISASEALSKYFNHVLGPIGEALR